MSGQVGPSWNPTWRATRHRAFALLRQTLTSYGRKIITVSLPVALIACQSMSAKPERTTEYITKLVYPMIDAELLTCDPEPVPAIGINTDAAALAWTEDVRRAGKDCRAKVDAFRATVAKWPKPE